MNKLSKEELIKVEGGSLKVGMGICLVIGGAITFIIGAVSGFFSNLTCQTSK